MHAYPLIVFDFDGTLANTLPAVAACMQQAFRDFGLPPPEESAVAGIIGLPAAECFQRLASGELPLQEAEAMVAHYRGRYPEFEHLARLYEGAADVLRELRASGLHLAAASNKGERVLQANAEAFDIAPCFDLLVGDRTDAPSKPDPRVLSDRIWPRIPGAGPGNTLVVGDAEPDMALARAAGAECVLAGWGYGDREACLRQGPLAVLEDIRELPRFLKIRSR